MYVDNVFQLWRQYERENRFSILVYSVRIIWVFADFPRVHSQVHSASLLNRIKKSEAILFLFMKFRYIVRSAFEGESLSRKLGKFILQYKLILTNEYPFTLFGMTCPVTQRRKASWVSKWEPHEWLMNEWMFLLCHPFLKFPRFAPCECQVLNHSVSEATENTCRSLLFLKFPIFQFPDSINQGALGLWTLKCSCMRVLFSPVKPCPHLILVQDEVNCVPSLKHATCLEVRG